MNSVPTLTPNSIQALQYIGGSGYRPVYLLRLTTGAQCVVKGEKTTNADACISLRWGSKLMKNVVSEDVNVKVLTQNELGEFARAAAALLPADQNLRDYLTQYAREIVWVRMPYIAGLSDSDIYRGGQAGADALYLKMNDDQFWKDLGKTLAVDLFIGNFDRFNEKGEFVNKGNIFFKDVGGGQYRTIGLDFLASQFLATGEANLARFQTVNEGFEYLKVLTDPAKRKAFAKKVRDELWEYLLSENSKGIYALGGVSKIEEGIAEGAEEIKRYLKRKFFQYASPMGSHRTPAPAPPAPARQARMHMGTHRTPPPPPVTNNNRAVDKNVVPEGIQKRMEFLRWI